MWSSEGHAGDRRAAAVGEHLITPAIILVFNRGISHSLPRLHLGLSHTWEAESAVGAEQKASGRRGAREADVSLFAPKHANRLGISSPKLEMDK